MIWSGFGQKSLSIVISFGCVKGYTDIYENHCICECLASCILWHSGGVHEVVKSLFVWPSISVNDSTYYWGINGASLADQRGCGRDDKLMRMVGLCVNCNHKKPSGL